MEPKLEWIEEWARAYVAAHDAKDLHTADENQIYWLCVFLLRLSKASGTATISAVRAYVDASIVDATGGMRAMLEDLDGILTEGGAM